MTNNILYIDFCALTQGYLYLNSYLREYSLDKYQKFDYISFNKNPMYQYRRGFESGDHVICNVSAALVPFFSILKSGDTGDIEQDFCEVGQEYFIHTAPIIRDFCSRIKGGISGLIGDYNIFLIRAYELTEPLILYTCMLIRDKCPDAVIILGDKNNYIDNVFMDVLFNGYIDSVVSGFGEDPLEDIVTRVYTGGVLPKTYTGGVPQKPFKPKHHVMFSAGCTALRFNYACSYGCSFCSNFNRIGACDRSIPVDEMVDNIKYIHDIYGRENIFVCDSLFYTKPEQLNDLYKGLCENGLSRVFLDTIYVKVSCVMKNPELYTRINGSFLCGIEHMSDEMLSIMGKGGSCRENMEFIRHFSSKNVRVEYNFLYNHPGESMELFNENIKFINIISRYNGASVVLNKFKLRANSPIHRNPQKYGVKYIYDERIPKLFNLKIGSVMVGYEDSLTTEKDDITKGLLDVFSIPAQRCLETPDKYKPDEILFYRGCDA